MTLSLRFYGVGFSVQGFGLKGLRFGVLGLWRGSGSMVVGFTNLGMHVSQRLRVSGLHHIAQPILPPSIAPPLLLLLPLPLLHSGPLDPL